MRMKNVNNPPLFQCIFAALLAVAVALPTADPKPEAKPDPLLITSYTAPIVRTAPIITYDAPMTYPDLIAPVVYNGYPYAGRVILV